MALPMRSRKIANLSSADRQSERGRYRPQRKDEMEGQESTVPGQVQPGRQDGGDRIGEAVISQCLEQREA